MCPLGRPRDPEIKQQQRWCESHKATTEHREYIRSGTESPQWRCTPCAHEATNRYYARVRAGEVVPVPRAAPKPSQGRLCGACGIEMGAAEPGPLCGECE